ncbi:MAG: transposase [Oscillospiraceae bacterium]|nr:transposase [Oscillospiraceae bacterium]
MKNLTESELEFIILRLVERANEAYAESDQDKTDIFKQGRRLAYYEMLDILRSELDAHDADLERFGLSEKIRI